MIRLALRIFFTGFWYRCTPAVIVALVVRLCLPLPLLRPRFEAFWLRDGAVWTLRRRVCDGQSAQADRQAGAIQAEMCTCMTSVLCGAMFGAKGFPIVEPELSHVW